MRCDDPSGGARDAAFATRLHRHLNLEVRARGYPAVAALRLLPPIVVNNAKSIGVSVLETPKRQLETPYRLRETPFRLRETPKRQRFGARNVV